MRKCLLAAVVCLCVPFAVAHDGTWDGSIGGIGDTFTIDVTHQDDAPWKGLFTLTVTNTSNSAWGDFHFGLFNAQGVVYGTNGGLYPTKDGGAVNYALSNNDTQLDLYFYNAPVNPGNQVTFQVYTDNTANKNAFFGVCFYPTPVPEPATMSILGLGALALFRRK